MDQALIDLAANDLAVTDLQRLREGAQKFVARGVRGGETVVIKVVSLSSIQNAHEVLERARREVDLLGDIDHPNIVKLVHGLHEVGNNPPKGAAWLEEYLDGEDLRDRLGVPWNWDDASRLGLHLARGLTILHDRNVIHRDLSPNNVRCLSSGDFVIMDPGYARHIDRTTLTALGQPGTPGFLSPEHLSTAGPIPASDVFCVGILMYLSLTGDLPIPLTANVALYQDTLRSGQAPSIAHSRPDLTAPQFEIVDRCLDRQPARRYLDATELTEALGHT